MKIFRWLNKFLFLAICVLGIVCVLALCIFRYFEGDLDFFKQNEIVILSLLGAMIIGIISELLIHSIRDDLSDLSNSEYRKYLSSKIKVSDSIDNDTEESKNEDEKIEVPVEEKEDRIDSDIFALMLKNNDETTGYFSISKRQAKMAYTVSVCTCIAGIIFLMVAVIILFVLQRIDLAVIPTISGAVTEVISGTVLWIYNKSAMQLNHYYNALHENERFLSAVNLVSKLSENLQDINLQDMMYIEIIRSQLPPAKELQTEQKLEVKKK